MCEDDLYVMWSFEIQGFQDQNYWNNDFVSCCFAVEPSTTFTRCLHSITECRILSFAHVPNILMFCHCHFLSCHTIMTEQMLIHNLLSWAPWTTTTVCVQARSDIITAKIRHYREESRQFGGEIMFAESWTQVNAWLHLHRLEIKTCTLSYSATEKFPAICGKKSGLLVVDAPTTPLVKLFLLKKSFLKCCEKKSATSCWWCFQILRWTLNPKDRETEKFPGTFCGKKSSASLNLWILEKKSFQVFVVARICCLLVILFPREKFVVATDPLLDARYLEMLACYRTL